METLLSLWLIVCKGNTCRSPMFMVLLQDALRKKGLGQVTVESAGILAEAAGQPAAPESVECMSRLGLDLRPHVSRFVGSLDINAYDKIVCMEPEVLKAIVALRPKGEVSLANEREGGIPNPWQQGQFAYDICALTIQRVVKEMVQAL